MVWTSQSQKTQSCLKNVIFRRFKFSLGVFFNAQQKAESGGSRGSYGALFSPFVFFCASTHHRGVAVRQRSFFPHFLPWFGQKTKHWKRFFCEAGKGSDLKKAGAQTLRSFPASLYVCAACCMFVLPCSHFQLLFPAEQGSAARTERPGWNVYNGVWKLWLRWL